MSKRKSRKAKSAKLSKSGAQQRKSGPRPFGSRDGYQASLLDVYDPFSRADAGFYLAAPSGSLHLSGSMPPDGTPRVVLAWPAAGQNGLVAGWVPPEELPLLSQHKDFRGAELEVAASRPTPAVAAIIGHAGAVQEIDGQITGYWFGPDEEIPSKPPDWDPSGALLPELHATPRSGPFYALSLAYLESMWRPISIAAAYTYLHTSGIMRGQKWRFVVASDHGPETYIVEAADDVHPDAIAPRFGDEAHRRARLDRSAVSFLATRESP